MASNDRGSWGSRWGFVLAAAGSAVGLGNVWKFPYITGENGGGLFVLIYLVCILLVGLPIMMAEIMIGRAAQKQAVTAFSELQGHKTGWSAIGWLGVIAGFVILSYYIVVAGWAMDYALKSVVNFTEPIEQRASVEAQLYRATTPLEDMREHLVSKRAIRMARKQVEDIRREAPPSVWEDHRAFEAVLKDAASNPQARDLLLEDEALRSNIETAEALVSRQNEIREQATAEASAHYAGMSAIEVRDEAEIVNRREAVARQVGETFGSLITDGWTCTFWSAIFMMLTILVVAGGISGGIERTCNILMPTLVVLIGFMVVYGMFQPGFGEALAFVFKPDASRLKASGVLEALGHAFFTLSLGMGAMITYGSYQKEKGGLASQSVLIAFLDTAIALLACMMIFPIIFSYGQEPQAGPGLVFVSMPLAFAEIGRGGMLLAVLFFGLLVFAALTSSISLLEVVSSYFIDGLNWSRRRAAWILGLAVFSLSLPSGWSSDSDFAMSSWTPGYGKNFFDTMDYLASNWMLPLGGLFISIYAGWVMPRRMRDAQLEGLSGGLVTVWLLLIRFLAPVLVVLVLVQKVNILPLDELLHGLF